MSEAMDGFYSSVSLERALDDYSFVALDTNGAPLPPPGRRGSVPPRR